MLSLIPQTFGNRSPDVFGNVHTRVDHRGYIVYRWPGHYAGKHRRV